MDLSAGIAFLSLVVSFGACIYTRRSSIIARDAIKTANKPILRVWIDDGRSTDPSEFVFYIENNGNGPAFVERAEYSTGKDYTSNLFGLFTYYASRKSLSYNPLERSYAIGKDAKILIVGIKLSDLSELDRNRAYTDVVALSVLLKYSTVTGEKFSVLLRTS